MASPHFTEINHGSSHLDEIRVQEGEPVQTVKRPTVVPPQQYRSLSFPTLIYVFKAPRGEFRVLRFAVPELSTPAVQNILRIMTYLHGTPLLFNRIGEFVTEEPSRDEISDALKFTEVLEARESVA